MREKNKNIEKELVSIGLTGIKVEYTAPRTPQQNATSGKAFCFPL